MIPFPTDITRVAFAGDWHGNYVWAQQMIDKVGQKADIIVHTGDFAFWFTTRFLHVVNAVLERQDKILVFVEGNHDDYNYLNSLPVDDDGVRRITERIWHLPRGFTWNWQGVEFLAMGGAVSIDRETRSENYDWWSQETIKPSDTHYLVENDIKADVIISHDTMAGHHIPGLMPDGFIPKHILRECDEHRLIMSDIAKQVGARFNIHGHYHSSYTAQGVDGVLILGLDCDSTTFEKNVAILDVADFYQEV